MIAAATQQAQARPHPIAPPSDNLTRVDILWIEKQTEQWIRFGREVGERIIDRRRRIVAFRPDSIFAFVRWAANDYGTIASRIDIVRAVASGEPFQTLSQVQPGGDILLSITGWPKVELVLHHIDAVEAAGIDPCDAAPDHWRHVAHRMSAALAPRAYTSERHNAWLRRREIER